MGFRSVCALAVRGEVGQHESSRWSSGSASSRSPAERWAKNRPYSVASSESCVGTSFRQRSKLFFADPRSPTLKLGLHFHAGLAPGRPEVEENGLSSLTRELHRLVQALAPFDRRRGRRWLRGPRQGRAEQERRRHNDRFRGAEPSVPGEPNCHDWTTTPPRGSLAGARCVLVLLLRPVRHALRGLLNDRRNSLRLRHVHGVTALDFDNL